MNQVNILKDKILSKKFEIRKSILIRYIIKFWFLDVGHLTGEKLHDHVT